MTTVFVALTGIESDPRAETYCSKLCRLDALGRRGGWFHALELRNDLHREFDEVCKNCDAIIPADVVETFGAITVRYPAIKGFVDERDVTTRLHIHVEGTNVIARKFRARKTFKLCTVDQVVDFVEIAR